jgi:15-cis-phytoene desaturase
VSFTTNLVSFAEQSRTTFQNCKNRLSVILAKPDKYLNVDRKQLIDIVIKDTQKIGINIKDKILRYEKIIEPDDFYLLAPGSEKLRPEQHTPIKNLILAGDYTKQKYLATMEGAVYSGMVAAKYL